MTEKEIKEIKKIIYENGKYKPIAVKKVLDTFYER
jgi:hypothetical protein